jgi:hypothetical protein
MYPITMMDIFSASWAQTPDLDSDWPNLTHAQEIITCLPVSVQYSLSLLDILSAPWA